MCGSDDTLLFVIAVVIHVVTNTCINSLMKLNILFIGLCDDCI